MKTILVLFAIVMSFLMLHTAGFSVNLTQVGSNYYNDVNDLAYKGDYAICAMEYGLMILDISDYSVPQFVSNVYQGMEHTRGLALSGDYAYIYGNTTLYIYDVTDVYNPGFVDSFFVGGTIQYVLAYNDLLYACRHSSGLSVIDISNPVVPFIEVTYPTTGSALKIERMVGDSMYCIATTLGIELINRHTGYVHEFSSNNTLGQISDLKHEVVNKLYCVSIFDSVLILNVADLYNLNNIVGSFAGGEPYSIDVQDTIAYVGDVNTGVISYNVADPANVTQIADIGYYGTFNLHDSLLTLLRDTEIWFYDISNPTSLNYLEKYRVFNYENDLVLRGPTAYAAGRHFAIQDISDLDGDPELLGACYLENALGLALNGDYAFVICGDSTVKTIDISDPYNPGIVASLPIADRLEGIAIHGNYVYVSSSNSNLYILNATTPTALTISNTISMGLYFNKINIRDGFLYAGKLNIYDLTDPVNPSLSGSPTNSGFTHDFTIDSIWALYTYDYPEPYMGGLTIYNVENPTSPSFVSHIVLGEETGSVAVDYPHAFLTSLYGRVLYIVDVSAPETPESTGIFVSPEDRFINLEHWSGNLYAVGERGLTVLKYSSLCGDVNGDGAVNVGDPIFLVNWIFKGGPAPFDPVLADVNCDNHENIGDAVYMINYIFKGGDAPCADCPL